MKLVVLTLFLLAGVCGSQQKEIPSAVLDQEFTLKRGQRVEIKTEELQIQFSSVVQDSRCPKGVQCISEGKGVIELELTKGKKKPESVQLNTASDTEEAASQGYSVRLIALDPYPSMNQSIAPDDYEATLVVSVAGK